MDKETFSEYVENRYKGQLGYYDKAAGKNQKKYRTCQWALIILSALTPILVALDTTWMYQKITVVIVSATVAILTTGLKTFQYQELWVSYRSTYEQLEPELHYYSFGVGPYSSADTDKEALFVNRVEAILDKEHASWPAKKMNEEKNKAEGENKSSNSAANT